MNVSGVTIGGYNGTFTITSVTSTTFTYNDSATGLASSGDGIVTGTGSSTQTAYLQPGSSISQNVTFSGGYADITLYATQNVPPSSPVRARHHPDAHERRPGHQQRPAHPRKRGCRGYSGNQNGFVGTRSEAFYTGASDYTYTVTFTNTTALRHGLFDNVAIQTVNGMFNETAAVQLPNISGDVQSDVALALRYGLYDVGYEGGFDFNQNLSGYLVLNGYRNMGWQG